MFDDVVETGQAGDRSDIGALHVALLSWYAIHARVLPWRTDPSPYHVLVSEFMLQQTQVERVVPYYHAFLAQFPTVRSLAEAPVADVIRAWQGLGYNRRAIRLKEIAVQVMDEHEGVIPSDVPTLLRMRGIGTYTAAAIASFAYGTDTATVDTNIRRVYRRLRHGLTAPALGERAAQKQADELLPPGRAADWNQALMDLGATICTAHRPRCVACPVNHLCVAYASYRGTGEANAAAYFARYEAGTRPAKVERPFAGSSRYYRGRIVATLGALPPGTFLPLRALGHAIREERGGYEAGWLDALVDGLARDGLIEISAAKEGAMPEVSLPRTNAIDRPAAAVGGADADTVARGRDVHQPELWHEHGG